jgi:CPA1 family monovalent cation:H+ antiporter
LSPLLGSRLTEILDSVLRSRVEVAEQALNDMRQRLGQSTTALERRLLRLFALRRGQAALEQMLSEQLISKEVDDSIRRELDNAWRASVARAGLGNGHPK